MAKHEGTSHSIHRGFKDICSVVLQKCVKICLIFLVKRKAADGTEKPKRPRNNKACKSMKALLESVGPLISVIYEYFITFSLVF